MSRRAWVLFALLSAIWGASYMFIKIALDDGVPPAWIVVLRTALAALVLAALALHLGALAGLRGRLGAVAVLALLQVAAPFMLITVGEQEISSSLTGILVATAPIFTFLLAFVIDHDERAGPVGLLGVGLGIVGVALLLGVDAGGGLAALAGGLMVVLASLGYALGAYYLKRNLGDLQPVGVAAASLAASALMTAPLAALDLPAEAPGTGALAAIVALGVLGTGVAFGIYYTLIADIGPTKTSLVAYVAPGFAVAYGVALLGEGFSAATAAGLVLIVGGSWLAAEGRLPRRAVATEAPAQAISQAGQSARLSAMTPNDGVTIRLAEAGDRPTLERLALLDSGRFPGGAALVAEIDGDLLAALPLDGGRAFADPFRRTADLVRLLELRARQLRSREPWRPGARPELAAGRVDVAAAG